MGNFQINLLIGLKHQNKTMIEENKKNPRKDAESFHLTARVSGVEEAFAGERQGSKEVAGLEFRLGVLAKYFNLRILFTPGAGEVWAISDSLRKYWVLYT